MTNWGCSLFMKRLELPIYCFDDVPFVCPKKFVPPLGQNKGITNSSLALVVVRKLVDKET